MRLGNLVEISNGYAFKSSQYVDNGIRVIRITNVQKGKIEDNDPKYYDKSTLPQLLRYTIEEGDILMSLTGNVGRVGLFPKELTPAYLNQRVARIRVTSSDLDSQYLFYVLNSDRFENDAINNSTGVAQLNLSTKWVNEYEIPLPPLEEQKKIAAILDAADDYRQKTKALIDKYDQLTKSLFLDMFGDPVTNPMGWEKQELNSICTKISVGFVGTCEPYYCSKEDGVAMLRTGNLGEGYLRLSNLKYVTYDFHDKQKKSQLAAGDLLIARHGDNGKAVLYKGEFNQANCLNIIILRPSNRLKSLYVQFLLNNENTRKMMAGRTGGATQKVINTKEIQKLEVTVPPINFQNQFTERVAHIEKQKQQAEASLVKAEELFSSLLQRAFKGELTS